MDVSNINKFRNGWFIGNFEPALHKTEAFEVAHHFHKKGIIGKMHTHRVAEEVTYIVTGKLKASGQILSAGDIFVYHPGEVSEVEFLEDTNLIVVKWPSLPDDKFEVVNIKNTYDTNIKWELTTIKGLKGIPTFGKDDKRDALDYIQEFPFDWGLRVNSGNGQFSENNGKTLVDIIKSKPNADLFVEIGTASKFEHSSTELFIENKNDNTTFASIDITVRSNNNNNNRPNVQYITSDSIGDRVKEFLNDKKIDILLIDGDHSIERVFKEFEFYLPYMKTDGVILLHDASFHPGPYLLMEAIDENVYRKEKLHTDDLGLGIIYLK